MTALWNQLENLSEEIYSTFDKAFVKSDIRFDLDFPGWQDHFWESQNIRKCHLKIIDHRETRSLWLMHINIFPRETANLPILGFDIVSGPNKITGAFFDYSANQEHPFGNYMKHVTSDVKWKKPRELPQWANEIFSENMIAAGNIRHGEEVDQLCKITTDLINYYVDNVVENNYNSTINFKDWHNKYCANQKLNPHLHKSILAMGISEEQKNYYINNFLFEEI